MNHRTVTASAASALACGAAVLALGCVRPQATAPSPRSAAEPAAELGDPNFSDVPDAVDAPPGVEAETLDSKVSEVTVYSDRARVTRTAETEVTTESRVFAFRRLPGWVDDGSVRVAASTGRIVDVRVERNFLAKATDSNCQAAEEEHERLSAEMAALTDELAILDAQKAQIESIKAFSLEKITKDTTIGDVSVESYGSVLEFIGDSLRKTAAARREVQSEIDDLRPEHEASARRLEELESLVKLEETTVYVTLQASRKAPSTLELTYMMPGATWEPMHELRVDTEDDRRVEVISFASVTQTSGEDWRNAEISFSTQSTQQSVRIPELDALTLGDTATTSRVLTSRISSFSRAQQAFAGQSRLWNKVHQASFSSNSADFERVYQENLDYLQVVQSKTVRIFESLENRGTTAHFKAKTVHSVRGDGHPTRLRIGRSVLESEQRIVAVPERSLNAARTLEMLNTTGQSFLPGKVALYQDGAFIGMTEIDFIADGERFAMFLSVADHVKLSRELDRKRSSIVHRKRNRMRVSFVVTAENLSDRPTEMTLADRVPVSENREIRVSRVQIDPGADPDSRGLLHWKVKLAPKESREFRVGYQVDYPPQLIIDARRRRAVQPAASAPPPAKLEAPTVSPYDFEDAPVKGDYDVEQQLMQIEDML
jgi:uncharacterized protein (TIGR02231 family)